MGRHVGYYDKRIADEEDKLQRKRTLLAAVRGGHVEPSKISKDDAIRALLADIEECEQNITFYRGWNDA